MRDIADGIASWRAAGTRFALATVVRTWSSAPRAPGAAMAVCADGEVLGSVSGGCVEADVYGVAREVIAAGTARLCAYGVSDDDAFAVGLTCGGTIEVLITPDADWMDEVVGELRAGRPVAVSSVIAGPHGVGAHRVHPPDGPTGVVRSGPDEVFTQAFLPPPRMLVFGATDFAGALVRMGKFLGYRVTVCDARAVFTTPQRFPDADEVVVQWPHRYLAATAVDERTVICVLTHDPKFDVPLLRAALRTPARYIGALGSRRTHEDRLRRLRAEGVDATAFTRICAPIGLDLGGRTPEETAVAIAAEIVALARGGTGRRLADLDLPIHR
jgi:xanthine dehydrogenase accessory factor